MSASVILAEPESLHWLLFVLAWRIATRESRRNRKNVGKYGDSGFARMTAL
jgi:hypothetical protein